MALAEPRRSPSNKRVVLTTFGSLGDLHPYIAIALGLRARGHEAVLATGECYRRKIETLGLGFRPVRPDCDWVADPDVMRRFMDVRSGTVRVIRELLLPTLRQSYEDTLAAADGADLLVANLASYAGRLVAETKGLPWASAMHIPMGFFSAYDPPLLPGAPVLSKHLRFLGPGFWKPLGGFLKWLTHSWAKPWYRLRSEIGLAPAAASNPLVDGHSPWLHLALFSERLAGKQRDWPPQTVVTGFPWHDRDRAAGLPAALARFLEDGPPPFVFTLGSAVVVDAGPFYEHSAAAAARLGRRAVLIRKDSRNRLADLPAGVAAYDYAPFAELFPRAALIVHHGGIGTTGLAMRSGRPMLVMPCAWDQPDNAARAARLGIARIVARHQYTPARVAAQLGRLLEDTKYAQRAAAVGEQVRQEDGVQAACDALEALIQRACSGHSLGRARA
jgi:UDP:flavonoid glycosyltransferase YjiC (YdhE family)